MDSFAAPSGPVPGTRAYDAVERKRDSRFLWRSYVAAVLIPIVGLIIAIYVAVSERGASIRRHAIGIAATAILTGAVFVVVISAVNSANADGRVTSDLENLLTQHGVTYTSATCSHSSGNQYSCIVDTGNGPQGVQVTDDGQSIYEQGISAP